MEENKQQEGGWGLAIISMVCLAFIIFSVYRGCESSNEKYKEETETTESTTESGTEGESMAEYLAKKGTTWDISTEKDEMYNSTSVWATLTSNNTSRFTNSIGGDTYLKIVVRHTKKYGTDVYLKVETGQFFGSDYYGTDHVNVKFDGGAVRKYKFNESSDGSSNVIFIAKAQDFLSHLKKAKVIFIEAPFYDEGVQRFQFDVDFPLMWDLNNIDKMRDQRANRK